MCRDSALRWAAGLAAALGFCACSGGGGKAGGGGAPAPAADAEAGGSMSGDVGTAGAPSPADAAAPPTAAPPANFEATHANLRFKGPARLREEYARVLRLAPEALCQELGRFDCIAEIHQIALGGVEPYKANIFTPFPGVAVGAPLAVERVALAACGERVRRDFAAPAEAVFFGGLPLRGEALTSFDAPEVERALTRLFREALLREPTAADRAALRQLYADTEAAGDATPAKTWAQLACMTVLTTTEAVLF